MPKINEWLHVFALMVTDCIKSARRACACILVMLLTLSCVACSQQHSSVKHLRKVSFMLWWAPDTNHIGVYVAKNKGWFEKAGIDLDVLAVSQTGSEHAVDSGAADFALTTLTGVADFSTKGANIRQVMQIEQKPNAIWCALASNTKIRSPRDFDGSTFATFGSAESDAVIRRMIRRDGGKGVFDKVTVGTSTFRTLETGKADFGGFFGTWEGVQAQLHGPKLRCFKAQDYGVPGNPDTIGVITHKRTIQRDPELVRKFVKVVRRGYQYAYEHPDEASAILVKQAPEANLDIRLVKRSMHMIVDGQYWGDRQALRKGTFTFGATDFAGAQQYFDFLSKEHAYTDNKGHVVGRTPQAKDLATDEFLQ